MLVAIHENVSKLNRQGRSLNEIIAAKPTADHDAKWGQFVIHLPFLLSWSTKVFDAQGQPEAISEPILRQ
jgi:hypothetical protein